MKSFSFPSDIPIRPDTVCRSPCAIYRIRTRRPPRPLEVSMPRSLNLPQAILAIALHAAGRSLLTQELAVLAGKPQEAIASLLEPLLGAGFAAVPKPRTRGFAPACRMPCGTNSCAFSSGTPLRAASPMPSRGSGLRTWPSTTAPPSPRPSATSSASSGRAASSAWNARCAS